MSAVWVWRRPPLIVVFLLLIVRSASGQEAQSPHEHGAEGSLLASREASGTAWQPDDAPMYGLHRQSGAWEVMFHGNAFAQLLHEGARGGMTEGGGINWLMVMAARPAAAGRFGIRGMLSLEPWTIHGCGYPNLLASGETCNGHTIHDRQHPHDLLMELAAHFDRPLLASSRWQIYGGLAGEPALGPPGFPHRLSAMPNPLSPIAHHWLDATHVTFGVITSGVYSDRWKAEASVFNGREPDDKRYDIDLGALDSFSARLSLAPLPSLALQVSGGRLNDAETNEAPGGPGVDVTRLTASVTYHRRSNARFWAGTIAWGANLESGITTHGMTAESNLTISERHTWFGRAELNGKSDHDLDLHDLEGVVTVGKVQGGYTRYLQPRHGLTPGVGATVSAGFVPEAARASYGGSVGFGIGIFLTVRPMPHQMPNPASSASPTAHVMVQTSLDPARLSCSPAIDPKAAAFMSYAGQTYFFCTAKERDAFLTNPEMSLLMMPPKE